MRVKSIQSILFFFCTIPCIVLAADQPVVNLGRWTNQELGRIIAETRHLETPGDRISVLSRSFINTPYAADTLIGGPSKAEQLVINLAAFDCYTLLDVIEALRRSEDLDDFPVQLKQVRYRGGEVTYNNRRHFFSDWVNDNTGRITDITAVIGQGSTHVVVKQLNLKNDGTHWLPGIPVTQREIAYIPTNKIDRVVLRGLRAGDYVGIYSDHAGLDVSHTGLLVQGQAGFMLRHASSLQGVKRVVDVELLEYLQGKPGLLVYRAR